MSDSIFVRIPFLSRGLLAGGMVAAGLAVSAPAFASEVDLTLVLGTSGTTKTWKAYATIANDPNSGGLDDLLFDVKTTGSILLNGATQGNLKLPGGGFTPLAFSPTDGTGPYKAGFFQLVQFNNVAGSGPSSYTDIQYGGGQDVQYHGDNGATTNDNLAHFFGAPGVTSGQVGDSLVNYGSSGANAALVAQGTYTGASGTIAITGDAKNFAILNTQFFFTDSLGNSNVAAHGVDTVQG
ncbi:MAG: hypothetical protein JWL69_3335, partial [Phycisphaerales bacterium]|nr:hypothetical protein [Phycisphaerales bacterium]